MVVGSRGGDGLIAGTNWGGFAMLHQMQGAYYVKGLVDFERTPNLFEHWFRADLTKRPPSTARKSFDALRHVVQQFPNSIFAGWAGFKRNDAYFQASEASREAPKVNFAPTTSAPQGSPQPAPAH